VNYRFQQVGKPPQIRGGETPVWRLFENQVGALAIGGTAREKNERLAKQCCDKQAVGIDPTCADPRGRM
jgi:hypothetical protein